MTHDKEPQSTRYLSAEEEYDQQRLRANERLMDQGMPTGEAITDYYWGLIRELKAVYTSAIPGFRWAIDHPMSGDPIEEKVSIDMKISCPQGADQNEQKPYSSSDAENIDFPLYSGPGDFSVEQSASLWAKDVEIIKKYGFADTGADTQIKSGYFTRQFMKYYGKDKIGTAHLIIGHDKMVAIGLNLGCFLSEQHWTRTPPVPPSRPR